MTSNVNKNKIDYILDEGMLSRRIEKKVRHPIRLFALAGLGVNQERFIKNISKKFFKLPWDLYDVHFLHAKQPFRKRSAAQFILTFSLPKDVWNTKRVPLKFFSQKVQGNDLRSSKRIFKESESVLTDSSDFQKLLVMLARIVQSVRVDVRRLKIIFHQVSTITRAGQPGDCAPEGIHQDGADYIVSAIKIAEKNVRGGKSIIYGFDKKEKILSRILEVGEGLFHADKKSSFWHDATPITFNPIQKGGSGYRNTIGFDIFIEN